MVNYAQIYCLKCKKKTPNVSPHEVTRSGHIMVEAKCKTCGSTKYMTQGMKEPKPKSKPQKGGAAMKLQVQGPLGFRVPEQMPTYGVIKPIKPTEPSRWVKMPAQKFTL